jgi:hypothetical protein
MGITLLNFAVVTALTPRLGAERLNARSNKGQFRIQSTGTLFGKESSFKMFIFNTLRNETKPFVSRADGGSLDI